MENDQVVSRRTALVGGIAVVGAAGVLAGCASASSAGGTKTTGAAGGAASSPAAGGAALAKLADVPVGGAVAANAADGSAIIVAQPTAGQVVAFSAICTHAGCTVKPAGAELDCPCHGSKFDALTGAVKQGPAAKPLASVAVKVSGTDIVAG